VDDGADGERQEEEAREDGAVPPRHVELEAQDHREHEGRRPQREVDADDQRAAIPDH
jgi:hypothetical protein